MVVVYSPKNEGVVVVLAAVLGLFGLMGIGHMYIGKIGRGLAFLAVGIVLEILILPTILLAESMETLIGFMSLLFIVDIIIWIWQIYDAYSLAKYYNTYLAEHEKPPW